MNWIMAHTDAVLFMIMCIIAGLSYFLGKDAGYVKGLEDGYKTGSKERARRLNG